MAFTASVDVPVVGNVDVGRQHCNGRVRYVLIKVTIISFEF